MIRFALLLLVILALSIGSIAYAEEQPITDMLTLEEARMIALSHHPRIQAGGMRLGAVKQDVKIARSNYLPQASGNAVRVFADDNTRIMAGSGITNPTILDRGALGVSASQLITDFGRTSDLVDASKLRVNAETSKLELTREMILLNVTRAYYDMLRAQALLKVTESTKAARQKFFERTSALSEAHLKSRLDKNLAQQGVQEANLLNLQAQGRLQAARAALGEALGLPTTYQGALAEPSNIPSVAPEASPLISEAILKNPEIIALQAEVAAAKKQADADEKSSYPTVNAMAFAGDSPLYNSNAAVSRSYAVAGFNISIPFYTGGRISAQHQKARYEASAAEQNLAVRKNELSRDVEAAWNLARTAFENIRVNQELMKNSADTLSLMQSGYELGRNSSVELAQAQLSATTAEIATTNARYDYLLQMASLQFMVGKQ